MAWVTIPTFTTGVLTTAQANYIRDNLQETVPAKASLPNQYPVSTGVNSVTMRRVQSASQLTTTLNTTSTNYSAAGGAPQVTVTTGTTALVTVFAQVTNDTNSSISFYAPAVTGDTTIAAADTRALTYGRFTSAVTIGASCVVYLTGLTAGQNTFTGMSRVTAGTGTFDNRRIVVMPY